MKKKVLIIFGTRPEFIKLYPLILEFNKKEFKNHFLLKVCFSGQHIELVENLICRTGLIIDYKLNVLDENQSLEQLTSKLISAFEHIVKQFNPDLTIVQGDTTTAFAGSLVSFYNKIKVAHIEAGLRTYHNYSPFPEEVNRKFISVLADFNFVPTNLAAKNLLKENVSKNKIFITGNTVIDACRIFSYKVNINYIKEKYSFLNKKFVLITFHRRENFGEKAIKFLDILNQIAKKYSDYNYIFSVHMNPNIKKVVYKKLLNSKNIILTDTIEYLDFVYYLKFCEFILTDSGGLQEEAFYFNKPVIVLRDYTERSEGIKTGKLFLTGIDEKKIFQVIHNLFTDNNKYNKNCKNPFGDGYAAKKILNHLSNKIGIL